MQSNESKLWLHRLFNADNFDTWLIISYLYRYTSPGIHYYLAKKLRCKTKEEINEVLPHLVHICETFNSQPLYNFLCEQSIECYFLVRDKKEMCDEILIKYKKKSKRIQKGRLQNYKGSVMNDKATETTTTNSSIEACKNKTEKQKLRKKRRNKAKKETNDTQTDASIKNDTTTDIITTQNTKVHPIQEYIVNLAKLSYKSFPCPKITSIEKTQINLQGILLHITKMISVIFDQNLSDNLSNYEQNFKKCKNKQRKQNYKTTVFSGNMFVSTNYILPSIHFADELVNILKRLMMLPRTIRQKGLEIEIGMLNYNLPADVFIPICKKKRVYNVVSDFSYVLDSAENSPYFVVFEVCDYGNVFVENCCEIESPVESISIQTHENNIDAYKQEDNDMNEEQQCKNIPDSDIYIQEDEYVYEQQHVIDNDSETNIHKNNGSSNVTIYEYNDDMKSQNETENTITSCADECLQMQDSVKEASKTNVEISEKAYEDITLYSNNMQIDKAGYIAGDIATYHNQKTTSDNNDNVIDLPTITETQKLDKKYSKAIIIDLKARNELNISYDKILSLNSSNVYKNNGISGDTLIYKNGAYLLHQLYDLQKNNTTNNSELSLIKENIINKIEDIKTERKNYGQISWNEKKKIIKEKSIYKNYKGYEIVSVIIKRGNDLRLEVLALQLLSEMQRIYKEANLNIFLKCYKIILINNKSAYIEAINDVDSIHNIKKKDKTLKEYFKKTHKEENDYRNAIKNFTVSLVGYSLATYFLQIKDRHNGNILIDKDGYMIHVDYGFVGVSDHSLQAATPGQRWIDG
ncbi:hypothetical protein BDAP_001986 [Binucleata daphniae]